MLVYEGKKLFQSLSHITMVILYNTCEAVTSANVAQAFVLCY